MLIRRRDFARLLVAVSLSWCARAAAASNPGPTTRPGPPVLVAERTFFVRNADALPPGWQERLQEAFVGEPSDDGWHCTVLVSTSPEEELPSGMRGRRLTLRMEVDPKSALTRDAKQQADEFVRIHQLSQILDDMQFPGRRYAMDKLELAVDRQENLNAQLRTLRDGLARSGIVASSPESLRSEAERLNAQVEQLEVDRAGLKARADALARESDRLTRGAADQADADPVSKELQKIAELREAQLAQVKASYRAGAAPDADVRAAEAAAAEARARLLERRDAAAKAVGADVLSDLNRELFKVTADLAEADARLKVLQEHRDRLRDATSTADNWEDVAAQLKDAATEVAQAKQQVETLQAATQEAARVTVTLVDSKDAPPTAPATTHP